MSCETNQTPGTVVTAQCVQAQPVQAQVNQVVQAQVVQAQVIGQPATAQVVGQPVYAGQVPVLQTPGTDQMAMMAYMEDQQAAQQAWMLYGIGCFLCWCLGPCGPCFWYGVACMYFCKPESEQKRLQQTRTAACVSLWTAVASTIAIIGIIILYAVVVAAAVSDASTGTYYYGYNSHRSYHSSYR